MSAVDYQTLADVLAEIQEQPPWRDAANREADYCDGNQLDTEALQAMADKGMKPTIENLIGPAIRDICGMEAKNRTDWRVEADDDQDEEAEQVAKAIGYKIVQAEKRSGADRAFTKAYNWLATVGAGYIEVARESDPFRFPYRVSAIHRNEVWRDWFGKEDDLSDCRWMLRRRWAHVDNVVKMFPRHKALITSAGTGWSRVDGLSLLGADAGDSTGLAMAQEIERGWSVEEQEWRDPNASRVCLFQLFLRDWHNVMILRLDSGRVVEFDKSDPLHMMAVAAGMPLEKSNISKISSHIFLGPHVLQSEQCEFNRYPLVEVFGSREDRTRVPYGVARWLMPLQDEINQRVTKQKWLLSAVRTIRTKGAVLMDDDVLRHEIGRADADILLDQRHMAMPGAQFKVETDLQLNQQQFQRLVDLRETVNRVSGVSQAFAGQGGADTASGLSQLIEQSVQSLAVINDNFAYARQQVGDLLLQMIIKDIGREQKPVTIKGDAIREAETIVLNSPAIDDETGQQVLTNDVQRTVLKLALNDVPSTPSFRQQQLTALSEAFKSAPPQYQAVMMPHLMHLANVPNKEEIIKAILEINKNQTLTEEQVNQRIQQAVEQAKTEWLVEQKTRELDIREKETDAKIKKLANEAVATAIGAIYSGTQAGIQIASVPGVAMAADQVLRSAGFQDQDAAPIVASGGPIVAPPVRQNTSPMFPPRVQEQDVPVPEEIGGSAIPGPAGGPGHGIEAAGLQPPL